MPPKKKNKNKPNGFLMYMLEKKHEFEAQEGRNLSMQDLVPLAHPGWKAVPEAQKQEYNARAKQHDKDTRAKKHNNGNEMAGKLDCTGLYVTDRIDGVAATKARRHAEYQTLLGNWPEGNGVCVEKFYMISFESLCELKDGTYIPLELGCAEYSLASGITNELHMFIDPGPIPMGYRYICKARSESRHNIPIEGFNTPTSNYENNVVGDYREVYERLGNFINPKRRTKVYPPMYCEFERRPEVEGCLRWLHEAACAEEVKIHTIFQRRRKIVGSLPCIFPLLCIRHESSSVCISMEEIGPNDFQTALENNNHGANVFSKIYEAEVLFCSLHEHAGNVRPSHSQSQDAFLTSAFDYLSKTRCAFHEEMETPMYYCALGKAKKNCYVLSDSLGSVYEIVPTSRHLPQVETASTFNFIPHNQFHAQNRGNRRPVTMDHNRYDEDHRSRSPNRPMPQPEPYVEPPQPEQQMRRPITMGKSGQIAGGMAPMRALEMGAGRGAPIQNAGLGRGRGVGGGPGKPGRGAPIQNPSSPNGKYAMRSNTAPPPSALPQPKFSSGGGDDGQRNTYEQLSATAAVNNNLSSDMATRLTLATGAAPKGIGRGIGRGISRETLYNGL